MGWTLPGALDGPCGQVCPAPCHWEDGCSGRCLMQAGAEMLERLPAGSLFLNYASIPLPFQMVIKEPQEACISLFLKPLQSRGWGVGGEGKRRGWGVGRAVGQGLGLDSQTCALTPFSRPLQLPDPSCNRFPAMEAVGPQLTLTSSYSYSPPPCSSISLQARTALTFSLCHREEGGRRGPGIRHTWLCHLQVA